MSKQTRRVTYDFRGAISPPAVASRQGIWCSKITKTAGTPLCAAVSGGSLDLVLDSTAEIQNVCLYMGDILPFDLDDIVRVEFLAKLSASIASGVSGAFGLAGARNDTLDSVATNLWFRFDASNAIVCETDDGTTDLDDKATGLSLSTSYRRFAIDLSCGLLTQSPPALSKGGAADVRFHMSDDRGALRPVATSTQFNAAAATGNVQLLAQLQKTAVAATATLSLLEASVELRLPA